MYRYLSMFFIAMLIAAPVQGELLPESEQSYRSNVVTEAIQHYCEPLLSQESFPGRAANELFTIRVARFYAARKFQPLWASQEVVAELIKAIEASFDDGLEPSMYHLAKIRELYKKPPATPQQKARCDFMLTESFLRLATHLRYGKVNPAALYPHWNIRPVRSSTAFDDKLQDAIVAQNIAVLFEELAPHDHNYTLLKRGLARYRAIARNGGWPTLAMSPTLKAGDRSSRIPLLRQRLRVSGDLPAGDADTSMVYTSDMVEGVKRFQWRNGLDADGEVGAMTLRVLNIPVEQRINQIRINLERYRWFLSDIEPTCILVNIPGYFLQYLENGRNQWGTRVIVGQPLRETPVFRAMVQSIVFNPKWVVPATILAKDVLPALNNSTAYLKKKQLRVVDGEGSTVNPDSVTWSKYSAETLPYRLQQRSGDKGALGRIKFMMPNLYEVYLHDTPSRELFDKSRRALSSGCIRVQNPQELARLVLNDTLTWSSIKIQEAIKTEKTRMVNLPRAIPVYLLYLTVVPNGNALLFRDDIYNRDNALLKALNR